MKQSTAYIMMMFVSFFWAGSFVAGKFSGPEIGAFTSSFLRLGIAAVILFPLAYRKSGGQMKVAKEDRKIMISLGLIGMFGYQVLFFISVNHTTVIATSTINSMNPIFVTLLLAAATRKRISLKTIIALLMSFFGVIMAITDGHFALLTDMITNVGNISIALAIFCWSVYGVITQLSGINNRYEPVLITWYVFVIATIGLIPFCIYEQPWVFMPEVTWKGWTAILYMAIFPSFIGYSLQQESIKAIGAQKTAIFINFVPIYSMLLSIWLLGDYFTPAKVVAIVAVIAGVVINNSEKWSMNYFRNIINWKTRKGG